MKTLFAHKAQADAFKQMKARGFTAITDSYSGVVMKRVTSDGFREKVTIDRTGRVRFYKPRKATTRERQRLPRNPYGEVSLRIK